MARGEAKCASKRRFPTCVRARKRQSRLHASSRSATFRGRSLVARSRSPMPARKSSPPQSAGVILPALPRRLLPLPSPRTLLPRVLSVLVAAVALSYGPTVDAGPLKGRITGKRSSFPTCTSRRSKPDSHRFTWREPSPTVRAEFRALSGNPSRDLCIAAFSARAAPPPEPTTRSSCASPAGTPSPPPSSSRPGRGSPSRITIPFLTASSSPAAPTWGAETIETTRRREWSAPPGAGRYEFRDELFPSVRTYVVVDPQVVDIAYPGRDGAFGLTFPRATSCSRPTSAASRSAAPSASRRRSAPRSISRTRSTSERAPDGKPLP
jgi:hypothetical protein